MTKGNFRSKLQGTSSRLGVTVGKKMAVPYSGTHDIFRQSIASVFKGWTGLQLAVQSGCGGPHAREKAEWMVEAVFNWFTENDGIHPDELEEFIAGILNNEFDTIAEDGSTLLVSQRICLDFDCCKSGNTEAVLERIKATAAANLQNSVQDPSVDMDDDDGPSMQDHNVQAMLGHVSIESSLEEPLQQNESDVERSTQGGAGPGKGDDGWTVVSKNRKR